MILSGEDRVLEGSLQWKMQFWSIFMLSERGYSLPQARVFPHLCIGVFFASSNLSFLDRDFAPRKLVGLIPYKIGLVKTMC